MRKMTVLSIRVFTIVVVHTQSTKLSSVMILQSTGLFPVINSKSMTPNEKTSDFSVSFPLDAYSGAKYLQRNRNV